MKTVDGSFVDANVLVYAATEDDLRHRASLDLLETVSADTLLVSCQVLSEFYSVITNPRRVTSPYAPEKAVRFIPGLLGAPHVKVLPMTLEVELRLLAILDFNEVRGAAVYDLQIAATMLAHGVSRLYTYNGKDFARFASIEVLEPQVVQ